MDAAQVWVRCAWVLILATVTSTAAQSAYEILESYNFPVGILPKGVTSYTIDESTGAFTATLNGSCAFAISGSYQLRYRSTISGLISENRLSQLKGVSVKVILLWLDIVSVSRDADELYFSVGLLSASFTVDNFLESPRCGCGFDCVDLRMVA